MTTERIKEDADCEGVRVRFVGLLGRARVAMQIAVGFGDVVTPGAETITYPALLDFPVPELSGTRASQIARACANGYWLPSFLLCPRLGGAAALGVAALGRLAHALLTSRGGGD